jgi:hypothetical protein
MIIVEKHTNSVSEAIIIIKEVFGSNSEFAKSISEFTNYKQHATPITSLSIINENSNTVTTSHNTFDALSDLKFRYNCYEIDSYKDFVEYALYTLSKNIPTPLNSSPYNLTIGNNFASIRFPNNISISIKTFISKDAIKYSVNIVFHCVPALDPYVRDSDEYKAAIANGWKVKDEHHKPIKKNI